jgi:hypothetical protein
MNPQLTYLDLIANFLARVDTDSFVLGMCCLAMLWLFVRVFSPKSDANSFMIGTGSMALFWILVRIFASRY